MERSKDGLIRKVTIKYRNASETRDRTTYRRSVRNLCKIWSEHDWNIQDDLTELAKRLSVMEDNDEIVENILHGRVDLQIEAIHL